MIFTDINDVFEIVPPGKYGGELLRSLPREQMPIIGVRGVNSIDIDQFERANDVDAQSRRHTPDRLAEERHKRLFDLVRSKVAHLRNWHFRLNGVVREVTSFDEWCRCAPPELVNWLFAICMSGEGLSAAEVKNFEPESDMGSPSPAKTA